MVQEQINQMHSGISYTGGFPYLITFSSVKSELRNKCLAPTSFITEYAAKS